MSEGFPYTDIIILAAIAAFIAMRLRGVLGQKTGFDPLEGMRRNKNAPERVISLPERNDRPDDAKKDPAKLFADVKDPETLAGMVAIHNADPSFNTKDFLAGARGAFEMVLDAFRKGDKETLHMLLAEPLFAEFAREVDARSSADAREESTLVSIESQTVTGAALLKNTAQVRVKFVSEQIHVTRNRDGSIVGGDSSTTVQVEDEWTFERDTNSKNPNWKITAT